MPIAQARLPNDGIKTLNNPILYRPTFIFLFFSPSFFSTSRIDPPLVFRECINLHFSSSFNLNLVTRRRPDQNANPDDRSYFEYHAFPNVFLFLSTFSNAWTIMGRKHEYGKTILDRYVSMTADNIPFLSPSISETLFLSFSLSLFAYF